MTVSCNVSPSFPCSNFIVAGFMSFIHLELDFVPGLIYRCSFPLQWMLLNIDLHGCSRCWDQEIVECTTLNRTFRQPQQMLGEYFEEWLGNEKQKDGENNWQPILTLLKIWLVTNQLFINKGLMEPSPCLLNYWLSCILGEKIKCVVFS